MAQPLSAPVAEHPTSPRPLVFPTDATVPESKEHLDLRTALYLVLCRELAATAWIGSDQFVYFDPNDPSKSVAPDLFVRRGGPDEAFKSWKIWERGAPEVAIEIVSESDASPAQWGKKLSNYHAIGVVELVRFEAGATTPLRVWDRLNGDLVERRIHGSRAASNVLSLGLLVVGDALRLEKDGVVLPTDSERADIEVRASEARVLEAARVAIADLAEAYGAPLDEQRRRWLGSASFDELGHARIALKRDRNWPALALRGGVASIRPRCPRTIRRRRATHSASNSVVAPALGPISRSLSAKSRRRCSLLAVRFSNAVSPEKMQLILNLTSERSCPIGSKVVASSSRCRSAVWHCSG